MANPVIKRYLSCEVFKKFRDELTNLYRTIREDKININADFWDMQFRRKDTITLYYKGCAFNFELRVLDSVPEYRLYVSDGLEKYIKEYMDETFIKEYYKRFINANVVNLNYIFNTYKSQFENVINKTKFGIGETERKMQQYITAVLKNDTDCFVVDYEVVVENVQEELGKVTFNKECQIKTQKEYKIFKELDLLVLKRNTNEKYELIPIEIKMKNNPDYRKAICQVNAYTRIVKEHIDDFICCYQKVVKQKSEIGILNTKLKDLKIDEIDTNIYKSPVVVIYDNPPSPRAQMIKNLKSILQNCEPACGFINQIVDAVPIVLGENHEENIKTIKAAIMGENK